MDGGEGWMSGWGFGLWCGGHLFGGCLKLGTRLLSDGMLFGLCRVVKL